MALRTGLILRRNLLTATVVMFVAGTGAFLILQDSLQVTNSYPRIAHAGGQVGSATYTNSIEALDQSYSAGFRMFEIDFSWTSDQQLVCLHDWEDSFERSFGLQTRGAVTLRQFEELVRQRSLYNKCTLVSFMDWFAAHPDTTLVTDIKDKNLDALSLISGSYPQYVSRIIPQVYQPEEAAFVKSLGFQNIIWTLYRYPGNNAAVLDMVRSMGVYAVTMDTVRAARGLPLDLDAMGVATYVHTINDYADTLYYKSRGVNEIYTDSLSPAREQALLEAGEVFLTDSELFKQDQLKQLEFTRRLEIFAEKTTVHYSLDKDFILDSIFTNQVTMNDFQSGILQITATGNDPYLSFPRLSNPQLALELHIQIQTPAYTWLQVFYTTQQQASFTEELKVDAELMRGSNEIVLSIHDESPITRLRLDPGTLPGEYAIQSFEIRSD